VLRFFEVKETLCFISRAIFSLQKAKSPPMGGAKRRTPLSRDAMFARQARFLLR